MSHPSNIKPFSLKYNIDTLIASVVAAIAATTSMVAGVSPWIMFIGWVAYFTAAKDIRGALSSIVCVVLGFALGVVASICLASLTPYLGMASLGVVVFIVAIFVLSVRCIPAIGNIASWFLGLITYFASHPELSISALLPIIGIIFFGALAGYAAFQLQQRIQTDK